MNIKITRGSLREWGACYDDERIAELVPPEGPTPRQVAELDIPVADRLWVLTTMPLPQRQDYARRAFIVREAMRHTTDAAVLAACERVATLCEGVAAGDAVDADAFWAAAAEAARAARAARAAWAAEAARAARAAWAAGAARAAAWAAGAEAARAAAWAEARAEASDRIIAGILGVLEAECTRLEES